MKIPIFAAAVILAGLLLTACRMANPTKPPESTTVTSPLASTPPTSTTSDQASNQSSAAGATQSSADSVPTVVPTATALMTTTQNNALAQYSGHSIYGSTTPLFAVRYSDSQWVVERDPSMDGVELAYKLTHRTILDCWLRLSEGAREYRQLTTRELAGQLWGISAGPKPSYLVYNTVHETYGFIFGLNLPENASEEVQKGCQQHAEVVLATFRVAGG
jgi:hypothetical protein